MSVSSSTGSYPGNASLPAEVREKILTTFRHTLDMYGAGKYNDCLIGCEFILKMDPRFTPARRLLEKARNPNADVDVAELESELAAQEPSPDGTPAAEAERLLEEAGASLSDRDFGTAIERAKQVLAAQPGNPKALAILEKAAGRNAAQPLFDALHQRADAALEKGRPEEARRELERMRLLDADDPTIALLQSRIDGASAEAGGGETRAPVHVERELFGSAGGSASSFANAPEPAAAQGENILGAEASEPQIGFGEPQVEEFTVPPREMPRAEPVPELPSFFSSPAEEDAGGEQEIEALLKQGDEAEQRGDRQQAIEIWSRVFLIDINNTEAVTRIEKSRQEMAEKTRRLAERLKTGRESFEAGDREKARQEFQEALLLEPDEPTARFYLERIQQGESIPAAPTAAAASAKQGPAERSAAPASPAPAAAPAVAPRKRLSLLEPKVLTVVGAFLVMTVIGVFFVFRSGGKTAASPSRDAGPAGARLQTGAPAKAAPGQGSAALPGESGAAAGSAAAGSDNDAARLRSAAEKAFAERRYIEALKNFNLAAPSFRGDPAFSQAMSQAADKVTAITPAVKLYNEGEYETAIPIFWRIYQEDRDNRDVRSYLFRSYFNQGITQLQNGLYAKAARNFQEALNLEPQDAEAARHRKFAERYQKGDLDLMGRIYVRHLSNRP